LNPAFIGGLVFILTWFIGKFGEESFVSNYDFTLIYGLILISIGLSFYILRFSGYYIYIPDKIPRRILYFAILAIVVNLYRFISVFSYFLTFNPRLVEANLAGNPVMTQIGFLSLPYIFYFNLCQTKSKFQKVLYYFSFLSVIVIPIKTHIITTIVLIYIAKYFSGNLNRLKLVIVILFGFMLVPAFTLIRMKAAVPVVSNNNFALEENFLVLELKKYTTYNVSNLALELENDDCHTYGRHIFGQLLDPMIYFLTLGNNRIIDRSNTDDGRRHPIDGRLMIQFSEGSNMGTSFRPFVYDFGRLGSLVSVFVFYSFINLIYFVILSKKNLQFTAAIFLTMALFTFWDFDWFETRYIFWIFLNLVFFKWMR